MKTAAMPAATAAPAPITAVCARAEAGAAGARIAVPPRGGGLSASRAHDRSDPGSARRQGTPPMRVYRVAWSGTGPGRVVVPDLCVRPGPPFS
jgi:hypothetical protein